jgi:CopG family nickel-responsive transcriptional regulator
MAELARIGVAIDEELLTKFDALIAKRGYTNRSEAFRDLIRHELIQEVWESSDVEMFGTVTLIYDHHVRMLAEKLTDLQHKYHSSIISSMHVHLDHDTCLEVILVRGKASVVQSLANALIATRGVRHGRFTATTPHE